MLRIFRLASSVYALEGPVFILSIPSITTCSVAKPLLSVKYSNYNGDGKCRSFSSSVGSLSPKTWQPNPKSHGEISRVFDALGTCNKGLLTSCTSSVVYEQSRSYWAREGRIGWRRKRRLEKEHREAILHPSSPVIDYKFPLPKDDFESLPSDLFEKPEKQESPEELMNAKNGVLNCINDQINNRLEGRLFAVIHVGGKQFKVTPEDIIIVQDHFHPTLGDQIRFHKVLLVGGKDFTLLGQPLLDKELIRVEATVIEKTLSYTKMHFKMKQRKNYRRLNFFKVNYTMLRINLIELMQPLNMIKSTYELMNQQSSNM